MPFFQVSLSQLYMAYRIILYTGIMKKSEKLKGKQVVALKKKKQLQYGLLAGAGVVIVAILLLVVFNPFVVKGGDTVNVFYTGTLDDGTIFDSNTNGTPLTFTVGKGTVIPGFEEAVIGMAVNNEKTVRIPPEKAYGLYNASFVLVVNRSAFPSNMTPVVGQYYSVRSTIDGSESSVKVINVTAATITLDENHALAGQNLTFTIRLVAINPK
jgi:peptidylprolyl isomerase